MALEAVRISGRFVSQEHGKMRVRVAVKAKGDLSGSTMRPLLPVALRYLAICIRARLWESFGLKVKRAHW